MRSLVLACSALVACSTETSAVSIELAPDVISSIDGTLAVRAIAFADRVPVVEETIQIAVAYTDRHGAPHAIAPIEGRTGIDGSFEATLTGFSFDGIGAATAQIAGTTIAATATFAVLDRTPPTVTITPPAAGQVRVGGDVTIQVAATDEIGVSQVFFEAGSGFERDRGEIVASGTTAANVSFDLKVKDSTPAGSTITLYALAADLSGNLAAAEPVTVTVQP
jgi:hypothetical protein